MGESADAFQVRTVFGGVLSIAALLVICVLFFYELQWLQFKEMFSCRFDGANVIEKKNKRPKTCFKLRKWITVFWLP